MAHLQPTASMLPALPPSRFSSAIRWLQMLDDECRSGRWEARIACAADNGIGTDTNMEAEMQEGMPDDEAHMSDATYEGLADEDAGIIMKEDVTDVEPDVVIQQQQSPSADNNAALEHPDGYANQPTDAGDEPEDQPTQSQMMVPVTSLKLRQATWRQVGRPSQQRQRVLKKKPVPLERLSAPESDCWQLQQIVSTEAAIAAVRGRKIAYSDLCAQLDVCLITEKRLLDNSDNLSCAACGQRNAYWDDCGTCGNMRTLMSSVCQ